MDKAEHTEMSTRHTELYIGMEAWGKLGYQLGYTHTVIYRLIQCCTKTVKAYQGIFRYKTKITVSLYIVVHPGISKYIRNDDTLYILVCLGVSRYKS